ncbi:HAD-IIIC family phosphatase [Echinicola sp. CAU 1574]|uniref:HAD-IIIC family phosphatase n=1 Tax=Echinicola arenosa TaxID=2774144 RepID=A0ABR9AHL2_9BACT|nr:HAD-IIIC family phosphatase [Echinicola arenosa]MBD8488273.1 HAD-IIIC family phosphatase [Echinicola arenosa]
MNTVAPKVEKIKLVIWDLDETFWHGTLSEEGIRPNEKNIELVKTLSKRGILNSIVSKNNYDQAKQKLEELGIWDYFVFPSIAWSPKGTLIKELITKCQLRDNNVMFLDDNHSNLEEAKYYNPNIHVHLPEFIDEILLHEAFAGKDDMNLSRLNQYKVLEKKFEASRKHDSNIDFLKASNIKVLLITKLENHLDRIHELLDRTNQLNFTKKRLSQDEIQKLITDPNLNCALVKVVDNFGDYGLVGFYAYHRINHQLVHFVFSCRILNLGIPQYLFAKLDFPILKTIPEVAENLDDSTPNWITEIESNIQKPFAPIKQSNSQLIRILYRGTCDFKQTLFYLSNSGINVKQETNYVTNNLPIYQTHTQTLVNQLELSKGLIAEICQSHFIPFLDKAYFESVVFEGNYDCLVYNLQTDYIQQVYRHRQLNYQLPLGTDNEVLTKAEKHPYILQKLKARGLNKINKSTLKQFSEAFIDIGLIAPEVFYENLIKIRQNIPNHIPIIFINSSEVTHPKSLSQNSSLRAKEMNQVLDKFIKESPNSYLLDMRKIISKPSQFSNSIGQFNRESYRMIATAIMEKVGKITHKKINSNISSFTYFKGQIRMSILQAKNFFRKSIWLKIKRFNFIFAIDLLPELANLEISLLINNPLF